MFEINVCYYEGIHNFAREDKYDSDIADHDMYLVRHVFCSINRYSFFFIKTLSKIFIYKFVYGKWKYIIFYAVKSI